MRAAIVAAVDAFALTWVAAYCAWIVGRRAGRLAGQQLARVIGQLPAYSSAALVVALPALVLAWAVYR